MQYMKDDDDKKVMDDNTFYYRVVRAIVIGFVAFCLGGWASCNHAEYLRVTSPGYRFQEVRIRLDDDNGQKDAPVIHQTVMEGTSNAQ